MFIHSNKIITLSTYKIIKPIDDKNILFSKKGGTWYRSLPKSKDISKPELLHLNNIKLIPKEQLYIYSIHNSKINIIFDEHLSVKREFKLKQIFND